MFISKNFHIFFVLIVCIRSTLTGLPARIQH